MAEAKINEECIIGLPTCGYAFSSSRMAFIATPADDEFQLEIDILLDLLKEKEYEGYVALRQINPGKFAFCTKICSKIITSQFCIVMLNSSSHKTEPSIKIPNPNVHLEYGLILAFKKFVLPFQREGDVLPFNINPLDTILYNKRNFKDIANESIDKAILSSSTTARPTRAIASNELLLRYIAVKGLRVSPLTNEDSKALYQVGMPLGFNLFDGNAIVYFGMFDLENAKEVVFRLKLLLQNLSQAYNRIETMSFTPDILEKVKRLWERISVEVLINDDLDKNMIVNKITELTQNLTVVPWEIIRSIDLEKKVKEEYDSIGEI